MKKFFSILIILLSQFAVYSQTNLIQQDSATIIIKNVSKYKFNCYLVYVKGQRHGGENLKPGKINQFKIATSNLAKGVNGNTYRFTVYFGKNCKDDKYDMPSMDYLAVKNNNINISTGTYIYLIDVNKGEDSGLSIELQKIE
jgi:hypothetical protein